VRVQKPREIAARVLLQRDRGADYIENLLDAELPSLGPGDRALCQELAYGVVRWQRTLDWLIARKTAGRTQKAALQILLRLGLYQMFWLDRIPDHAAVNETVALARQLGYGPQSGFINAALRGWARERDETKKRLEEIKTSQPGLGYSHPDWLCEGWQKRWGAQRLRQLLDWNNTPPKTYARVNSLRTDAAKLLEQWRGEGIEYDFVRRDWFEENLVFELKSHPPLATLPSFEQGLFYVQDPSTLLAVHELDPQPGETILDLCAAPGGKTSYIAQLMQNRGRLVAEDLNRIRLELLRENCARLGVACAEYACNSGIAIPELTAQVDRVLVDVPCSNTGVMRRRLDLRWRIRPEEIHRLRSAQLELLHDGAMQTKPGGVLVHSTCSLQPEENNEVVKEFLARHSDFKLENERELLPFVDGVDGAYVATLRRRPGRVGV
jgi:16S rRNA (cytosine967-C5)-methyltransferase